MPINVEYKENVHISNFKGTISTKPSFIEHVIKHHELKQTALQYTFNHNTIYPSLNIKNIKYLYLKMYSKAELSTMSVKDVRFGRRQQYAAKNCFLYSGGNSFFVSLH